MSSSPGEDLQSVLPLVLCFFCAQPSNSRGSSLSITKASALTRYVFCLQGAGLDVFAPNESSFYHSDTEDLSFRVRRVVCNWVITRCSHFFFAGCGSGCFPFQPNEGSFYPSDTEDLSFRVLFLCATGLEVRVHPKLALWLRFCSFWPPGRSKHVNSNPNPVAVYLFAGYGSGCVPAQ